MTADRAMYACVDVQNSVEDSGSLRRLGCSRPLPQECADEVSVSHVCLFILEVDQER